MQADLAGETAGNRIYTVHGAQLDDAVGGSILDDAYKLEASS